MNAVTLQPSTFGEWLAELVRVPWRDALLRYCDAVREGGYEGVLAVCERCDTGPLRLSAMVGHIRRVEAQHEQDQPCEPRIHQPGDVRPASQLEQVSTPREWAQATCRSCHRPVIWTHTTKGKRMPVDADPDPAGRLYLVPWPNDPIEPMAMSIADNEAALSAVDPTQLRTSHFATCPEADGWRRRG